MPVLGKVGLVNKGVYAAGTTYNALDFVKYNGSTFVALKSVKGVTPADDGTNWQYLARGAELALQNNLLTTQANTYALDAAQGPVIKAELDSLRTDLSSHIIVREYEIKDISINAQSGVWPESPSLAVSGYTPLAIVGYYCNIVAVPYSLRVLRDTQKANIALRNYTNQVVNGSFLFYVLYTKD